MLFGLSRSFRASRFSPSGASGHALWSGDKHGKHHRETVSILYKPPASGCISKMHIPGMFHMEWYRLCPASTLRVAPEMKEAAGESRKHTTDEI